MTARLQLDSYARIAPGAACSGFSLHKARRCCCSRCSPSLIAAPLLWRFAFTDSVALFGRIALLLLGVAGAGTSGPTRALACIAP